MNFYSIAPFIQQYYPQYYSIERYPAGRCVCIRVHHSRCHEVLPASQYEQCASFRDALAKTAERFIVEDQTSFPKKTADTWGVKLVQDEYVGPNLLGRLLMELRDNGNLSYRLPDDAFLFTQYL